MESFVSIIAKENYFYKSAYLKNFYSPNKCHVVQPTSILSLLKYQIILTFYNKAQAVKCHVV